MRTVAIWCLAVVLSAVGFPAIAAIPEEEVDQTVDSTVYLLRSAMTPRRDRRHQSLLLALRHLEDPELKPFFERLVTSRSMELRIHGILGLAECDAHHRLDLSRIAELDEAEAQINSVMAAMDNDLLTDQDAKQLLDWEGLDASVKEVVATQLVSHGKFEDTELLRPALKSDNPGRRSLAAMLLVQLGDTAAMDELTKLIATDDRTLAPVRQVMLRSVMRLKLDRAAPWALAVCRERSIPNRERYMALQVALRFSAPGAVDQWRSMYASNPGKAKRIKLALIALRVAPWVDGSLFQTLVESDDELIRELGRTGNAIAGSTDVPAAVDRLLATDNPIVNDWLFFYVRDQADAETAKNVLTVWLEYMRQRPPGKLASELPHMVRATQVMFDRDGQWAADTLRSLCVREDTPELFVQGVLMGMLRCRDHRVTRVVEGLGPFDANLANDLLLVLKARHGAELSESQLRDLAVLVRGGGGLPVSLRVQAGWAFVKRLGRQHQAITEALQP